ncbi:hypothetical protein [Microbacterium hydrocarbonoxydans]|uniref:hypothetical protein n=1 Tax=Microbacterium hydrocarbonoxydans TaxID=273678 RepID=UPI0007BC2FEE|nr:hypothetical protein [Microbacterium hydrocarbonoxydans]GAT74813.1 hypothetical protein MHM582_3321 [Microbacterium sp. HM58-2]
MTDPYRVEPVTGLPSASGRTLEQWLDAEYAAQTPPEAPTRLREIARDRAARRGLWAAFLGIGISAVMAAFGLYSLNGNSRTLAWALGGTLLAAVSVVMMRRAGSRVPPSGRTTTTRGPGSLPAALGLAGAVLLALNLLLLPSILMGWGGIRTVILVDTGMVLLLASVLVVPAAVMGDARVSLRRAAMADEKLAAALERERETWTPTPGVPMFGPL